MANTDEKTVTDHARSIPYTIPFTITLVVSLVVSYYTVFGKHCFYVCPFDWKNNLVARLLFHPLIHGSPSHLWGNVFGLVIVGALIETWIFPSSRKRALLLFMTSIAVSYIANLIFWFLLGGDPGIGSSGIAFSLFAFVIYFYYKCLERWQFQGMMRHAPLLLGVFVASLISPLFDLLGTSDSGLQLVPRSLGSFALHWLCFLITLLIAWQLFAKWRMLTSQRPKEEQRVSTSPF